MNQLQAIFGQTRQPIFFDGGMGTLVQSLGLTSAPPVTYNLTNADDIVLIHKNYLEAGADVITTNTFDAFSFKYSSYEELIEGAIKNAKQAVIEANKPNAKIAFGIGPTGKMMLPIGNASMDELYNIFSETAIAGDKFGVDFVLLETFGDIGELRCAVLAVKENTNLPVFCSVTYEANSRTLTGATPVCAMALLEGLGVECIGVNCGVGFDTIKSVVDEYVRYCSVPILVQPNAGLPEKQPDGGIMFKMTPELFANGMKAVCEKGAKFLGGCCGTTPMHIAKAITECKDIVITDACKNNLKILTSYAKTIDLEDGILQIGYSLCVNKNKKLYSLLKNRDYESIAEEVFDDIDEGADVLCVNVSIKGMDTALQIEAFKKTIEAVQQVSAMPMIFEIDNSNVLEAVLRQYMGIAGVIGNKNALSIHIINKYGAIILDQ